MAAPTAHPSPLRYVACISYPRSGHHLTVRVLQQYFKHDFKYCQFYNSQEGNCCQSFPCTDESVRMTKNHDMELNRPNAVGLQKQPEVPYLVLIRNFLEGSGYEVKVLEYTSGGQWRHLSARPGRRCCCYVVVAVSAYRSV